jgi:hypothetical protein
MAIRDLVKSTYRRLPETFKEPEAPAYVDGNIYTKLKADAIVAEFKRILDKFAVSHYGQGA